ncbi:hypothetical protein CRUP_013820 [Coryphaenoides rupestris]|nr:hypothetical protein CRUP_013820 [Coryphaenoides rupestris]
MWEYLDDPSVLTKEKLKSELARHHVELPGAGATKDVYVRLYLEKLTARNARMEPAAAAAATLDGDGGGGGGFSSDEDLPPPVVHNASRSSGRKAIRKTDKAVRSETLDVAELTAEGLKDELLKYGVDAGPIVASTRRVYEKKLLRLLDESTSPASPEVPPTQTEGAAANHNGQGDSDQFSDKEEEEVRVVPEPEPEVIPEPEPLPEPIPLVERLVRSRGKTPVTTRTRSSQHNKVQVEKVVVVEQTPRAQERDVLKEVFANDINSPTGIIASCRKPIRGAAGRPLQPSDFWNDENLLLSPKNIITSTSSTSTYSETRHRSAHLAPATPSFSASSSSASCSSASRLLSQAPPPAGQTEAARRSLSIWLKLFVLVLLVSFLFLVYLAMEANILGPFIGKSAPEKVTADASA